MKKLNKIIVIKILIVLFTLTSCGGVDDLTPVFLTDQTNDDDDDDQGQLAGNLEIILGDIKQAQIKELISTTVEVENLLKGFEELGVHGIRITIFPKDENPNKELFDYFFARAKAKGFKIMANPALWEGAVRIANKELYNTPLNNDDPHATGPSPLDNDEATNILIARIKEFANNYEVDWITPFNEDGKPGRFWSADQINKVYRELYNNINGAELMGPCTWGIPSGTLVLQQTDILQYITAATTHNLGFNHSAWQGFINVAGDIPVWDSEVNMNNSFPDLGTRLDAAIEAGVDGLVLYDSWRGISLTDGSLNNTGNLWKNTIYD